MPGKININSDICTGCGLCTQVCLLYNIVSSADGKAQADGDGFCVSCGHCAAVCPVSAITHSEIDAESIQPIIDANRLDYDSLLSFLKIRRSRREFKEDKVPQEIIEKLLTAAVQAPNALNNQTVEYTVITNPEVLGKMSKMIAQAMGKLPYILRHPVWSFLMRILQPSAYRLLMQLLPEMEQAADAIKSGKDMVIYNAPCVIAVHSPKDDPCPGENCVYAAANILLAAETLGLGTCVIGFITEPSKRDRRIKQLMQIPNNHEVYTTIALGYPKFKYSKSIGRKQSKINYVE